PPVGLGQFIGQPPPAPGGLAPPQRDHLRLRRWPRPGWLGWCPAGEPLPAGGAFGQEARLPIIEGPPPGVGPPPGPRHPAGRLPGLEQEPPLGRRGEREVRACHPILLARSHGCRVLHLYPSAWHIPPTRATCSCPQQARAPRDHPLGSADYP